MTSPAPTRTNGWNRQVRIASGLVVLAGLWLIISPWVLGIGFRRGALVNDPIIGVIVALLAVTRFLGPTTTEWPSWATIPFGIWTLISPWVYGFAGESHALEYSSVATALAIMILSFWAAVAGLEAEDVTHASYG